MPRPAPADPLPADVTAIAETCLELRAGALEVAVSARRLLDALSAVDPALAMVAQAQVAKAAEKALAEADSPRTITAGRSLAVATESSSALRASSAPGAATQPRDDAHTVASALLTGRSTTTLARVHGVGIESAYYVLAVSIPPHPGEIHPAVDGQLVARRRLRCLQAELGERYADRALWLLSTAGGTVLLPESVTDATALDTLIAGLAAVTQVALTATVMHAATPGIPGAAEQAHELLDIVHRLGCKPGLYRFDDLAMEYQLTRPGPGREYLDALLDPLEEYPELLETLRRHLGNDLNRRRTARALGVHANTIDYRLKRIGQLTGFDPAQSAGLWYLRSALVARTYRAGAEHSRQ